MDSRSGPLNRLAGSLILSTTLCLVGSLDLFAQVTTGTILGTVRDSSGGVIPGAEITATNLGTGFSRKTTADSEGQYALRLLPLGEYKLEASAQRFKTFVQTGILIEVGRNARVDPVLDVGALAEAVQITADSPLVETASATIGRVVTGDEIANMPLVNRNVYSLLSLMPGVDRAETTNTFGYPSQVTIVNGSPDASQGAVNYYLDGGSNVGGLRNTGNLVPNPDAIQEFRVVTNSFSAEYGRFGGGAVDVITKSGTNEYHGSLFEFFRNDALNANRWTPGTSAFKEPLERNQFGGTVGGPIRRQKTFFFGSYSGLRQETARFRNGAVVPTDAQRRGDFSQLVDGMGRPIFIRDPLLSGTCATLTGGPACFAGNIISLSRFDPTAKRILDEWIPRANLPGSFFEIQMPQPLDSDETQFKIDHALSASHQIMGSYFFVRRNENMPLLGTTNAALPWVEQNVSSKQHNLNLADNWVINSSMVNTLRLTYVRHFGSRVNTPPLTLGDFDSTFNAQGPPSLPNITVTGFFTLSSAIFGPTAGSNLYMLRDVLNVAKGRHSLRMGGEISLEKMIHDTTLNNYGTFSFDGTRTNSALVDFLLGVPRTMNQDAPVTKYDNLWYFSGFFQDDFRVGNRVTLNLGVRYDVQQAPVDPLDRKLTFVAGRRSQVVPSAPEGLLFPGDSGIGRGIIKGDKNNVAPRLGIAWDPTGDGRTAVRAGFGIFYGSVSGNEWNQTSDNQPFTIRQQFNNVFSLSDPYRNLPGGVSPYPYVYDPASPRFVFPAAIYGPSLDFVLPYTYQMNVAVQREIVRDFSVNVAYVGAIGRKYPISPDLNYPVFGPGATTANVDARRPIQPGRLSRINLIQSTLGTDYHGLQVSAERRGRILTVKAGYTFGKALEDASLGETTVQGSGATQPAQNSTNLAAERARTSTDRRHNFAASTIWKVNYFGERNRAVRILLNDWTVSAGVTLRSGEGVTVTSGQDNNRDGNNNDRANVVGDWRISGDRSRSERVDRWFDTAAFAPNAIGEDGNSQRNLLDGPAIRNVDVALFRDVQLNGRFTLQLRAEATNAFNLVSFNNPGANLNAPQTFGKIRTARNMREIQLGMRLTF